MSMQELAVAAEARVQLVALDVRISALERKVDELLAILEAYMARMNGIIDRALETEPSRGRSRDS